MIGALLVQQLARQPLTSQDTSKGIAGLEDAGVGAGDDDGWRCLSSIKKRGRRCTQMKADEKNENVLRFYPPFPA